MDFEKGRFEEVGSVGLIYIENPWTNDAQRRFHEAVWALLIAVYADLVG